MTDLILRCMSTIPRKMRIGFFTGFFSIFYHLYRERRLVTINNLKNAFPEKDMTEIMTIAKGVYRTLGIVAAEFFDIPSLNKDNINDLVEIEGLEHCKRALNKNKGILMFGGHFGNWELFAITFSLVLKPMVLIYRTLDNTFLDNLALQVRSCTGNILIDRKLAMRRMLRSLAKNEIIGLLIDQNTTSQEGVFVDFFGQPACTTNGIALLALHTGAPVIPANIVRLSDGKYKMIIKEEMQIVRTGDQNKDILINTQNFTRVIEDAVREYPDQWLWLHKRWRTKE
ncbi:MAG: lysophospholipid acyltransferase family protein [Syntrophaceae bacterium]